LGTGNNVDRARPGQVGTETNWQAVAAGTSHTLGLKSDGTLWAWGNNARGQLGGGTNSPGGRPSPAQVGTSADWNAVSGGNLFTLASRSDGSLWAWGENVNGQLGDGLNLNRFLPGPIGSDLDWLRIDAGDDHALALKTDGSLWAWGKNRDGQVGDGTFQDENLPIRIGGAMPWSRVSAGETHSVAVRLDGTLWIWGSNRYGQLADPDPFLPSPVETSNDWGWPDP
jgi:alpha-tubulin suppressor-like RCC1 family protein